MQQKTQSRKHCRTTRGINEDEMEHMVKVIGEKQNHAPKNEKEGMQTKLHSLKKNLKGVMKEMEESMNHKEIQGLQKTVNKVLKQMEKEIQLGIWTLGPKIKCY